MLYNEDEAESSSAAQQRESAAESSTDKKSLLDLACHHALNDLSSDDSKILNAEQPWKKALVILYRFTFINSFFSDEYQPQFNPLMQPLAKSINALFKSLSQCNDKADFTKALESFSAFKLHSFLKEVPYNFLFNVILMLRYFQQHAKFTGSPILDLSAIIQSLCMMIREIDQDDRQFPANVKEFVTNMIDKFGVAHFPENNEETLSMLPPPEQSFSEYFTSNTITYFKSASKEKQPKESQVCIFAEIYHYLANKHSQEVSRIPGAESKFVERLKNFNLLIRMLGNLYIHFNNFSGSQAGLKRFMEYNPIKSHGLTANKRYEQYLEKMAAMDDKTLLSHFCQWIQSDNYGEQSQQLLTWHDQYVKATKHPINIPLFFTVLCFYPIYDPTKLKDNDTIPQIFCSFILTNERNFITSLLNKIVTDKDLRRLFSYCDPWGNNVLHYLALNPVYVDLILPYIGQETLNILASAKNKDGNTPLHLLTVSHIDNGDSASDAFKDIIFHFRVSTPASIFYKKPVTYEEGNPASYQIQLNTLLMILGKLDPLQQGNLILTPNNKDSICILHLIIYYNIENCLYNPENKDQAQLDTNIQSLEKLFKIMTPNVIEVFYKHKCFRPKPEHYFLTQRERLVTSQYRGQYSNKDMLPPLAIMYRDDPRYCRVEKEMEREYYTAIELLELDVAKAALQALFDRHLVLKRLYDFAMEKNAFSERIAPNDEGSSSGASKTPAFAYVPRLYDAINTYISDPNMAQDEFNKLLEDTFIRPINNNNDYIKSRLLTYLETLKTMSKDVTALRFNEMKENFENLRKKSKEVKQAEGDNEFNVTAPPASEL